MNWEPNGLRTFEEFWNLLKEEGKWIHEFVYCGEDLEGPYHKVIFATDDWDEIDKKFKEFYKTGYKGFFQMSENTSRSEPKEIHRIKMTREKDFNDL